MRLSLFLQHCNAQWIYLPFFFVQIVISSPTYATANTATAHQETAQGSNWGQSLTIDTFQNPHRNDLGHWHGFGEDLPIEYGTGHVDLFPSDPDHVYSTVLSTDKSCFNLLPYKQRGMFLHVVFAGTDRFSISLNQNNGNCDAKRYPYPETSDSVEARRYTYTGTKTVNSTIPNNCRRSNEKVQEIYVPLDHFEIDHELVSSISFHGFYNRSHATTGTNSSLDSGNGWLKLTLHHVSIVDGRNVPRYFKIPSKLPTGELVLRCSRPNSFAFGIDDGQPGLAQEVLKILEEEDILVTFFAVGSGLTDPQTNFTKFYKEMDDKGHQVALHSWSHPKLEGLPEEEIDSQITKNIQSLYEVLGIRTSYFRPPYGTVGARTRQRLSTLINEPYIINWSVDIEDWIWAGTDTPEKQLEAFKRGVDRGGNLAVLHYLSPSTVKYFREGIKYVKKKGLHIMRVDQCLQDPRSPGW